MTQALSGSFDPHFTGSDYDSDCGLDSDCRASPTLSFPAAKPSFLCMVVFGTDIRTAIWLECLSPVWIFGRTSLKRM
jgi:hypothetical protein